MLCAGPTGSGKTLCISNKLLNGMPQEYMSHFISFSARTSANQTQDMIDSKLDKRCVQPSIQFFLSQMQRDSSKLCFLLCCFNVGDRPLSVNVSSKLNPIFLSSESFLLLLERTLSVPFVHSFTCLVGYSMLLSANFFQIDSNILIFQAQGNVWSSTWQKLRPFHR